jgi:hypothetical protein
VKLAEIFPYGSNTQITARGNFAIMPHPNLSGADGSLSVYTNIDSGSLMGTGNRSVYSSSAGVLTNTSSDASLKENVTDLEYGLNEALALRPISFEWIDKERFGEQKEIGFIAQEVKEIVPEVIGINADETLSLDYPKLVAVLTNAIKELAARVEVLESQLSVNN